MVLEDMVFKALSHPVRREIIGLLAIAPRSVKELTAKFEMSQPAISQHLKELKTADLVTSERIGLEQHYRLTPQPLKYILHWSDAYRHLVDPSGHFWTFTSQNIGIRKFAAKERFGMAVEGSVPTPGVIVPHLVVRDAAEAVGFYVRAFGARVLYRSPSPSGAGEHIHVKIWDSLVQISTEEPTQRREKMEGALLASPETLSGSSVSSRSVFLTWTRHSDKPSTVGQSLPYLRPICFGAIVTAGFAIRSAMFGRSPRLRKF